MPSDEALLAYEDELAAVYLGDCLEVLRGMPDESVHCVVTSPPYWGLRDYGTATWEGGDPECDHVERRVTSRDGLAEWSAVNARGGGLKPADAPGISYREACGKCGGRRVDSQLGLEATPDEYVATMVGVFREVRRVLRSDGTLWLNLGDSYAGSWGAQSRGNETGEDKVRLEGRSPLNARRISEGAYQMGGVGTGSVKRTPGLKPKDLVGIPWRVAFALQADGWYLRSDIVWSKSNPMPESVTDRPTKAHEYLFLLAKSERYFYDAEAIREPAVGSNHHDLTGNGYLAPGQGPQIGNRKALAGPTYERHRSSVQGGQDLRAEPTAHRNKRSVWTIATQPFSGAHFAVFPEALVEPCILAGCPADGVVLDMFAGSGTTLAVAKRLGRRSVGIELNPAYLDLIRRRVARVTHQPSLFTEAAG